MRVPLIAFFFAFVLLSFGQQNPLNGVVKDQETTEALIGAHIKNLASGSATSSNHEGVFSIPAQVGDTLLFSFIGYQLLGWTVKEEWFDQNLVTFELSPDTIYLAEVVIGKLPEYDRFKQLIIETQPVDTAFEIFGLAAIPMDVPPAVTEADMQKGPSLGFTFDMGGMTKRGKEKKKMMQILERKGMIQKAESKFSREWVSQETRLEGDQLTSFIAYCKFTPEFLSETSLFVIYEKMMGLLQNFEAEYSEG